MSSAPILVLTPGLALWSRLVLVAILIVLLATVLTAILASSLALLASVMTASLAPPRGSSVAT